MRSAEGDARDPWDGILDTVTQAGALKQLLRQGWVDRGVDDPESVADHSFRLALLVLLLATMQPEIDRERALILALVHDLPEALTGDQTPFDELLAAPDADRDEIFRRRPTYSASADQAKRDAEAAAIRTMSASLPEPLATLIIDAWEEYEAGETPEARLVRQADKLETWLQALEYRRDQPELIIDSFRIGTEEMVTDPRLRLLLTAMGNRFDADD